MVNRYYLVIFFLLLLLRVNGQETVKIKDIRSSTLANYEHQRGGSSIGKLIDGKRAKNTPMWLDPDALGWQSKETITFDIELERLSELKNIILSTAADEKVNASNPLSVSLFLSLDGVSYQFIEDIADRSKDNIGHYRTFTLGAKDIHARGKFVRLVVYPQGRLFFADEIQIIGSKGKSANANRALSSSGVLDIAKQNVETEKFKALLLNQITNKKSTLISEITNKSRVDNALYENYRSKIATDGISPSVSNTISLKALTSPWGINTNNLSYYNNQKIELTGVVNTSSYLLLEVANDTRKKQITQFNLNVSAEFKIFDLTRVATRDLKQVYDPLIPINNNSNIELNPGEKKYLLIDFQGLKTNKINGKISLGKNAAQSLSFVINSYDLRITDDFINKLNFGVNVWPYYSYKFFQNRESLIKEDLNNHHVNVLPLAPWALGAGGAVNRKEILRQLSYKNKNDVILLFLNHGSLLSNPGDYLQPSWMNRFLTWYDEVMELLKSQNIPSEKVFLYPFDEVQTKEVSSFNKFTELMKAARPDAQIYLTIFNGSVLKDLTDKVDLLQVVTTKNDFSKLNLKGKYWIYDIMDDAKSTDAHFRYRVQPWIAYYYDAEGVGLWNYADMQGNSIWDDTDGGKGDFNVVYDYKNTIIPSIRWEAFKQGVEDYYILKAYEAKFGKTKLKSLMRPLMDGKTLNAKALESLRKELIMNMVKK